MGKRFPYVARTFGPGVCRFCGCSHFDPCDNGCGWADRAQTLCTECRSAADAEERALLNHARIRNSAGLCLAFHRGFVVGWFAVVRQCRSPKGRRARSIFEAESNPYLAPVYSRAWDAGHTDGAAGRLRFLALHGEHAIDNHPRPFVYRRDVSLHAEAMA